ncbi:hypothetical protein AB4167_14600 [Vibrio sp. 10N.286.49.E11]|uniref:restriction endonuclease n=1 Tax=Vibrio sp. 10N.286.49.E11 TaxID=3229703 RepID=UPI003551B660
MKKIDDKEISEELSQRYKPAAMSVGNTNLPLNQLSDRDFEILTYHLLKAEINNGEHKGYSDIILMPGVGERGRDCVIYSNEKVVAVVQCKKYSSKITKPSFLRELIKFLLHLTIDDKLFFGDNVKYLFYVSSSLNEPTLSITKQFKTGIAKEIDSGEVDKFVKQVVSEYESFQGYVDNEPYEEIARLLKKTTVQVCDGVDLTQRIKLKQNIMKTFFEVQSVIDIEAHKNVVLDAMTDFGFANLLDMDIKHLHKRIDGMEDEKRVNFGSFDFYGYDISFFKRLTPEALGEIFKAISNLQTTVSKQLFDFLGEKINTATQEKITKVFLVNDVIHPYTVSIIPTYLLKRCNFTLIANTLPEELRKKYYPDQFMSKKEIMNLVIDEMIISSTKFLNGDYSNIKGNQHEISFKINYMFPQIHRGLSNEQDIRVQIQRDLSIVQDTIDRIEDEIVSILESEKTIVIKDSHMLKDKEMLSKVRKTLDNIR